MGSQKPVGSRRSVYHSGHHDGKTQALSRGVLKRKCQREGSAALHAPKQDVARLYDYLDGAVLDAEAAVVTEHTEDGVIATARTVTVQDGATGH